MLMFDNGPPEASSETTNGAHKFSEQTKPALSITGLGKRFRTFAGPGQRVLAAFMPQLAFGNDFWALRDINLRIYPGECFGIIGQNGSGKSTLLKLITGSLYPTEGHITANGRVLALLELGTGLNPELTARQNVHSASVMLGMPPDYPVQKMDAIEEFADIGPYFDRPMKFFSSGMFVRVAFALYMFMDPEIFIVDEALSVGDVFFQQKCTAALRHMMGRGTTVLFVSHDTGAVRALCNRAAILKDGSCIAVGEPAEIVNLYHTTLNRPQAELVVEEEPTEESSNDWRDKVRAETLLTGANRTTDGKMELLGCRLARSNNTRSTVFRTRDRARIQLAVRANAPIAIPSLGFALTDRFDSLVFATSNVNLEHHLSPMVAGDVADLEFEIDLNLSPGEYILMVNAADKAGSDAANSGAFHDQHDLLGPITVFWDEPMHPFYGVVELPVTVTDRAKASR